MVSITFLNFGELFVLSASFVRFAVVIIFKRKNGKKESQKGVERAER
jgi:hypothetical protein